MGDDIVKKKMIVLIAFIYIASMLFCGDGVGKKFVEEKGLGSRVHIPQDGEVIVTGSGKN